MSDNRPFFIPVILGTPAARALQRTRRQVRSQRNRQTQRVETELIDIRDLHLPATDAGEVIKDARFSETVMRADGLIIVAPEG